jgi:hypothetical protein
MNETNKALKAGNNNARIVSASELKIRYGNNGLTNRQAIAYGAEMFKLGINYAVIAISQGEDPDKGDGTK